VRFSSPRDLVAEFHSTFGLDVAAQPTVEVPEDVVQVRLSLLTEEVEEVREAVQARDLVAIADALADLVYVAYGTALTFGIELDDVLREVHRSNMTKLDAEGLPVRRADGKILKSPLYEAPKIADVLGLPAALRADVAEARS
jgi:predicted HAD superfamily Cof-like phosphohydrolase